MLTGKLVVRFIEAADCCPWDAASGRRERRRLLPRHAAHRPLYTPDERRRRDESRWTLVQGVLAPLQFAVFLVSLGLVLRYLGTGHGLALATASVVVKTLVLYAIMVTGSIWERAVFGRYLFAPAFYWEDVVSILVLALHTAYLVALSSGAVDAERQMWLALAAYVTYAVNATQFLLKLRAARRDTGAWSPSTLLEPTS
jgi:3-vinyl bacteriochlorophyllide hydratase